MTAYRDMTKEELTTLKSALEEDYAAQKAKGLSLNMARGKPSSAQLDLSLPMLDTIDAASDLDDDGTDCRNYGVLDGLPEAKKLLGDMCGMPEQNMIVFGNSSLNVMFDTVGHAWTHGVCGEEPWCYQDSVKFLCPVPGYDRHFGVTEFFGIEMIPVPTDENGPDMNLVEQLVTDSAVKGIWCVPMYANPTGIVYSDEVVRRFARLQPAAGDFRIFWDNAYCIHHLSADHPTLANLFDEARAAGNEDIFYTFCSTSKVTFPGSGIAGLGASTRNLEDIKSQMKFQTIGHDKINQLRHIRFFGDIDGMKSHMEKHAAIIAPKFAAVEEALENELGGLEIGSWTNPKGGYFISFDALPGCAKRIVDLAKEAGVTMTGAGATWPHKNDPEDRNIRIAPTLPTPDELTRAAGIFVLCVKLASVEKLLAR